MSTRYEQWMGRAMAHNRPVKAHFELTYRCNATCKHCYQERDHAPDELSLDEWKRTAEQAREAGALTITLSGGEAMLSPHFWPLAEHVRTLGMGFRVFTNGLLLNRKNCRRLAALHPVSVEVSVFSTDPAVHDEVTRVPGSLRKALLGLRMLKRLGVATKLKCPLLDTSSKDFQKVRDLSERLGCSLVFDPFISPKFTGNPGPTQCRGDDHILYEFFVDDLARKGHLEPKSSRRPEDPLCGVGRMFTTVGPDGRVLPCPRMQIEVGNVRRQSLGQIWEEAPLLNKFRQTTFGDLPGCGTCARSGYCNRCSATALLEDGDLFGPSSESCHVAEIKERAWGILPPPGVPAPKKPSARLAILGG